MDGAEISTEIFWKETSKYHNVTYAVNHRIKAVLQFQIHKARKLVRGSDVAPFTNMV